MLALFTCGVFGYITTRWLKAHVCSRVLQVPKTAGLAEPLSGKTESSEFDARATSPSKQPAKRQRRQAKQKAAPAAPVAAYAAVAAAAAAAQQQQLAQQPELEQTMEKEKPQVQDRVAKLMAKKALRKARKALQQAVDLPNARAADLPETQFATAPTEAADTPAAKAVDTRAAENVRSPAAVIADAESPRPEPVQCIEEEAPCVTKEAAEEVVDENFEEDSEPDPSERAVHEGYDTDKQDPGFETLEPASCTIPNHRVPGCAEVEPEEEEDSDDEEVWEMGEEETPADGWSCSWDSNHRSGQYWKGQSWSKPKWTRHRQDDDQWMLPFDDLISGHGLCMSPAAVPPGPLCIWGEVARAPGDVNREIFTDGQQLYHPVSSSNGQPFFTDGHQLYAAVCIGMHGGSPEPQAGDVATEELEEKCELTTRPTVDASSEEDERCVDALLEYLDTDTSNASEPESNAEVAAIE